MKIVSIAVYRTYLPLVDGSYAWADGKSVSEYDSTVVIVTTDTGVSGVGEAVPLGPNYLPSYAAGVRAGIRELGPRLIGEDPTQLTVLNHLMDYHLKGHPYVKTALDMANSNCMQTAADHEATVKAREEELKVIAEAREVLSSSTSGAVSQTYSLLAVESHTVSSLRTRADLANAEVINLVKKLAKECQYCAAYEDVLIDYKFEKNCERHEKPNCYTAYKEVCTPESKEECTTTYTEECHVDYKTGKQCKKIPHKNCKYVQVPKCGQVPYQKCEEGYEDKCKEIPKKIGEKVTKHRCEWPERTVHDDTSC